MLFTVVEAGKAALLRGSTWTGRAFKHQNSSLAKLFDTNFYQCHKNEIKPVI